MSERMLRKLTAVGLRLTAAIFIRAVGAVGLFIALITGWDAGTIAQALKLLRSTSVTGTFGGCSDGNNGRFTAGVDKHWDYTDLESDYCKCS